MMMAVSICSSSSRISHHHLLPTNPISFLFFPSSSFLSPRKPPCRFRALRAKSEAGSGSSRSGGDAGDPALLRKPVISVEKSDGEDRETKGGDEWVDWEDQILEDTVPLVGFVRMILHSGKYVFFLQLNFPLLGFQGFGVPFYIYVHLHLVRIFPLIM